MKLRIQQRPSLLGQSNVFWYHAQIKRLGIWIDCNKDLILPLMYSQEMMMQSHDTCLDRVEKFIDFVLHKQEMYPAQKNVVIKEYEA
jgi:hypothetical protein